LDSSGETDDRPRSLWYHQGFILPITKRVNAPPRKRLGEILIERGKLDEAGLERALRLQQDGGERLGALLVTLGVCAQRDVAEALAAQLELPLLDLKGYPEFPILEERI